MSHEAFAEPQAQSEAAFSSVLRERTKQVHYEAERTGFIADLIRGRSSRRGYAFYLRNLVPVYAALEDALDGYLNEPVVGAFADRRLRRLPALMRDLAALEGPAWPEALALTNEASTYAAAIGARAKCDRFGLIAHAYARYLGDLSGGQILKPVLARNLGLAPAQLTFYDFPDLADAGAAKSSMRRALDRISVGSAEAETLIREAVAAFRYNISVSLAVQEHLA